MSQKGMDEMQATHGNYFDPPAGADKNMVIGIATMQ